MIVTYLCGGLGNQLFQYAMGRHLAHLHNAELLFDARTFAPDSIQRLPELRQFSRKLRIFEFSVSAREATASEIAAVRDAYYTSSNFHRAVRLVRRLRPQFLWNSAHVLQRQYRFEPEALLFPDNIYLQGYWQSYKYFADIDLVIRRELRLMNNEIAESAAEAVADLKRKYGEVVAVHIRRGDNAYAHEQLRRANITSGPPVSLTYIQKAMQEFSTGTGFFIFSDSPEDIAWCRENVRGPNLEFTAAASDIWDFAAMTCCDHNIIGNSTFSWWAA